MIMAREMKESGYAWIGAIPADWNIQKVKTAFYRSKAEAHIEDPVVLSLARSGVKIRDISTNEGQLAESYYNYNPVIPGDLLLNPMDLYSGANCSVSKVEGVISPAYINLRTKGNYSPTFYDYYFKTQYWAMALFAHGKGVSFDNRWTLSPVDLFNYVMPVPSYEEQVKIASFLDKKCAEIDSVIEKTKATIEEYKKLKQSVITEAITKGIHKNCNMKKTDYEWIGNIPSHWETIKVKWLLNERKEKSVDGREEPLSMSQKYGLIPTKEMDMIPNMASSFVGAKLVHIKDLVFNKLKAHLGVFAVSRYDGLVSPDYAVYYSSDIANVKYLEYLFKTPQYIAEFCKKSSGVGAGLTRLYTNDLFSIYCSLPPINEQEEIIDYLDQKCAEIDTLITKKTNLLTELETYKKSLIYEYITGKKEVGEVSDTTTVAIVYPYFPAVLSTDRVRFAQAVLMSKILDSNVKYMGRVKLEKMLFTIEHSIGFDFDTDYARQKAGPLDGSIYECEKIVSRTNKWFYVNKSQYGTSYKPQKNMGKYKRYYEQYFSDYNEEIESIISVFENYSLQQSEIVATLFAAWNDAIIDKKQFTDEDVVNDVLNNWHESKTRFSKDVWLRAMDEMRKNNLVPKGYGKKTVIKN